MLANLRHTIDYQGLRAVVTIQPLASDKATQNTAMLLEKIYGGITPTRSVEAANIIEKAQRDCRAFFDVVRKLATQRDDDATRSRWQKRISRELGPENSFAALRAWYVIEQGLAPEFSTELETLGYR